MNENEIDLSRFESCDIPRWLLAQLMRIPQFQNRVKEFGGTISNAWIMEEVSVLCDEITYSPYASSHYAKRIKQWRHSIMGADKWLRSHYDANGKRIQVKEVNG